MKPICASLKRLHSPDVDDLENYWPSDEACFGILVQAMFGPEGTDGEESFDIIVCNPGWLERETAKHGIVIGRHHLVVGSYDFKAIRDFLSSYGRRCEGQTWQEVAALLSRIGHWEFEDYAP